MSRNISSKMFFWVRDFLRAQELGLFSNYTYFEQLRHYIENKTSEKLNFLRLEVYVYGNIKSLV